MAGLWVPWLADAARLTGYPVVEVAGWRTRGTGGVGGGMHAVEGVALHHTAGPRTGEMPSLGVIRDGRAGLSGPLSHYGLGRSGTVYVVAAGACNHAGVSSWLGISGLNSRFIGIEAESVGDGAWEDRQLDCYPRLVAACLHYMRRDAARAAGHREVALPAGRKIDPAGIDMPAFRRRVAHLLTDPLRLIPRGAPPQEDSMPTVAELLDAPIKREGPGASGVTTVRAVAAWSDSNLRQLRSDIVDDVRKLLTPIERKLDELLARPSADVYLDAAAVREQLYAALGGGLQISGVATPIAGVATPIAATDTPAPEQGP